MILLLTPDGNVDGETDLINQFFEAGLPLLHIRKKHLSGDDLRRYILAIDVKYRAQLVLHRYHELAQDLHIKHLHFSEALRKSGVHEQYTKDYIWSTSVHSIQDFNSLRTDCCYAFISPIFPSISKRGYGQDSSILSQLKDRHNHQVKLIGLGGIRSTNMSIWKGAGLDGIALLGSIWQDEKPLKQMKQCILQG